MIQKWEMSHPSSRRAISLTSVSGKAVYQTLLEVTSRHMKNKKVFGNSQLGFTKAKLCLNNLTVFCDQLANFVGWSELGVHIAFWKVFDMVSHSFLIAKSIRYGLNR